jgi:PAS domain S-box-containing protein
LLCVAGYDGYLKKINPAVSKLLGYTNEELLSKPINDFVYFADQKNFYS